MFHLGLANPSKVRHDRKCHCKSEVALVRDIHGHPRTNVLLDCVNDSDQQDNVNEASKRIR